MRETGRMTKDMARAATPILMVVYLKESSTMRWHEAATHSLMELYTKDLSITGLIVMVATASRCWGSDLDAAHVKILTYVSPATKLPPTAMSLFKFLHPCNILLHCEYIVIVY